MTLRTLAGHQVHPIGLGCMSLSHAYGHPPSEAEGIRLVHQALDMGYTHLDTARLYGLGRNELLLGKALKGRREGVLLASKCGIVIDGETRRIDGRPETIRAAVETSLQSLQTDRIDLYYLHRRDFDTPIEESVGALAELVRDGKIGAIGLSEMSADTLRRAHAEHPVAAMQTEVLSDKRELVSKVADFAPVRRQVDAIRPRRRSGFP